MRATLPRSSTFLVIAAGGLLVGLMAGPVLGAATAPQRLYKVAPSVDGTTPEHTVSVGGARKGTGGPGLATGGLGGAVQAKTAKEARETAAVQMTKVVAAIKALGVEDKDIATSMVSLGPVYDYATTTQRITGYQLSNTVSVTVRNLDNLAAVLDDSVNAGATAVNGISFDVADRTGAEAKARVAAMGDAKAKADALTNAAGVSITGVASISETVSAPIWYSPQMGVAASGAKDDAATPVLPGSQDITITVNVSWLID